MLISHEREKLLEAVKYFAANTKYCGLTKLFKLLFFFDFTHFRETGRSVTGLNYQAWQRGPVPADLYGEIKAGGAASAKISLDKPLAHWPEQKMLLCNLNAKGLRVVGAVATA